MLVVLLYNQAQSNSSDLHELQDIMTMMLMNSYRLDS